MTESGQSWIGRLDPAMFVTGVRDSGDPSPPGRQEDVSVDRAIRPLHLCLMIDRLRQAGTEMQLRALIREFDRRLVRPHLCLLDGDDELSRSLEPDDCPILRLGVRKLCHPSSVWKILHLRDFLRRHRIDLFQAHFPDSTYFGVPAAWLSGVRRIILTRRDEGYWVTSTDRRLGWLVSRLAHATLANSVGARRSVIADYGLDPGKVVVLENGVDLTRFRGIGTDRPRARTSGPRVVGLVANLRPVKDPGLFLRAASRLAATHEDVIFRIAGEGELRPALERLAAELGIRDRVQFLGTVVDIPPVLAQLDVAVLSSRSEGLSNAMLEYMAAGCPIVATSVGANVELIEDGVDGLLVAAGDPDGMVQAIDRLLRDPESAREMGRAARNKVASHFSLSVKARELEAFYRSLFSPGIGGDRG